MNKEVKEIINIIDKALMKYSSENISCDVDHNGYTFCVMCCNNNDSFPIAENICDAELVDRELLIKELNKRNIGYCW